MGGFFSNPSPPSYDPPPLPTTDPDAEALKQRQETMARNRRGLAGMVATSDSGVLAPANGGGSSQTKNLLGE